MTQAKRSAVTTYLESFFSELERLHPARSVTSHGIAWDSDEGQLVLLFNLGDVVLPYPLNSSDLSSDPVAAAADLHRRASAKAQKSDPALITYKL